MKRLIYTFSFILLLFSANAGLAQSLERLPDYIGNAIQRHFEAIQNQQEEVFMEGFANVGMAKQMWEPAQSWYKNQTTLAGIVINHEEQYSIAAPAGGMYVLVPVSGKVDYGRNSRLPYDATRLVKVQRLLSSYSVDPERYIVLEIRMGNGRPFIVMPDPR